MNDKLEYKIIELPNAITFSIFSSLLLAFCLEILKFSYEIPLIFPGAILDISAVLSLVFFPEILQMLNINLLFNCFSRWSYFSYNITTFIFGKIFFFSLYHLLIKPCCMGLCIFFISHVIYHCGEFLFVCYCHLNTLSWGSFLINHSWAYFFAITAGFIEYYVGVCFSFEFKKSFYFVIAGIFFMAIGHFFRLGSFISAKSNFHHKIQYYKSPTHRLVTSGIYFYCRHPSYFGFFMFALGSQLILGNVFCLVIHGITLWRFFFERIEFEEATLINFFGDEYLKYKEKTPALIPFLDKSLAKSKKYFD